MKLISLTSTAWPSAQEVLRPAKSAAEPLVRRVGEVERMVPDRNPAPQEVLAHGTPREVTTAAQKVHELTLKLIRLGPQAKKLLKKQIPKHFLPVDEKV